jgi:hypothetical protein
MLEILLDPLIPIKMTLTNACDIIALRTNSATRELVPEIDKHSEIVASYNS